MLSCVPCVGTMSRFYQLATALPHSSISVMCGLHDPSFAVDKKTPVMGARAMTLAATLRTIIAVMPPELTALVCAFAVKPFRILPVLHAAAAHSRFQARALGEVYVELCMRNYRTAASDVARTNFFFCDEADYRFVVTGVTKDTPLAELLAVVRSAPITRNSFVGRLADHGIPSDSCAAGHSASADASKLVDCFAAFGSAAGHMTAKIGNDSLSADAWTSALKTATSIDHGNCLTLSLAPRRAKGWCDYYAWREVAAWFADGLLPVWPRSRTVFDEGEEEYLLSLPADHETFSPDAL